MIDIFLQVTTLKESAKANRDFSDYESALEDLNQAVEVLMQEASTTHEDSYKDHIDRELADCYGMIGGIYRRLAQINESDSKLFKSYLEKALDSYKNGKEIEKDDSYNESNFIIINILINPMQLINQKKEILEVLSKIQEQVKGKRRDQWWAWSDLGLFKLLSGDKQGALEAYSQFKQKGARETDYESTLAVLSDLQKQLQSAVLSDLQKQLQSADLSQITSTVQSIGEVIQQLEMSSTLQTQR